MDQPSIDGVNTWFISKAAKEAGLKVAISGLGGDEFLAGYPSLSTCHAGAADLARSASVPGVGRLARVLLQAASPGLVRDTSKGLGLLEYANIGPALIFCDGACTCRTSYTDLWIRQFAR